MQNRLTCAFKARSEVRSIFRVLPKSVYLTCMFGAFVFLQFTVLGLANHAGEGYLTTGQRDLVYYALQVFVILGYVLSSVFFRFRVGKSGIMAAGTFSLFFVSGVLLFRVSVDSLLYVIVSMTAALCIGRIGGAVHHRMSLETVKGANAAQCMGFGSSAAIAMQYLLQIQWGVTPLLPVFMLAAFLLLIFLMPHSHPEAAPERDKERKRTPPKLIVFSALIAAAFILFTCFYNESIHHLMIQSGYAANVYSWPRLMMVPVYLLFALTGDRKNGKYVPIVSLCIILIALLNVVLISNAEAYWLNMCFFYFAIAAYTCYYLLTFWRLATGTEYPAFWAPFGRMLDSFMVLFTGAIHLSELPAPVVMGLDIAGLALIILLMAIKGDFNLTTTPVVPEIVTVAPEAVPKPSPEDALERMGVRYALTAREMDVLRKLLLTDDELQPIADSLNFSLRTLNRHITCIYQKTDTKSRVGLYKLYHAILQES